MTIVEGLNPSAWFSLEFDLILNSLELEHRILAFNISLVSRVRQVRTSSFGFAMMLREIHELGRIISLPAMKVNTG